MSLLLSLIHTGCTPTLEERTAHSFLIRDENGLTIAENHGDPAYEGDLFTFTPQVVLQEDERSESLLNRPVQFLVDNDGYFYVNDRGDSRIAVYDPNGQFQRNIGREGDGPGEFRSPYIEYLRDGIIGISDIQHRRITRYYTDGTLLDVFTLPGSQGNRPSRNFHIADNQIIQVFHRFLNSETQAHSWVEVVIQSTDFDTICYIASDHVLTGYRYSREAMGRSMPATTRYAFSPNPMVDYDSSIGIVLSAGDRPVLDIFNETGQLTRQIMMDIGGEEVTATDRDAVVHYYQNGLKEEDERTRELTEQVLENLQFLDYKPPWYGFMLDDSGYIWLFDFAAYTLTSILAQGIDIKLLSPEGEYLGRTHLPPVAYLKIMGNQLLAIVEDAESGVVTLTAFEIRSAVKGFNYP